jgi:DnaJ-class molecular chaperone
MTAGEIMTKVLLDAGQLRQSQDKSNDGKAGVRQVCPHCNGVGKVPLDQVSGRVVPCSGCGGKGYR